MQDKAMEKQKVALAGLAGCQAEKAKNGVS
jgi:hypothetical protein